MHHSIFKKVILEMAKTHLNESYEDGLLELIFEEVSQETWEIIEETILNELSPNTLKSYIKKAKKDKFANSDEKYDKAQAANRGRWEKEPNFDPRVGSSNMKNIEKRKAGIKKAKDFLSNKL